MSDMEAMDKAFTFLIRAFGALLITATIGLALLILGSIDV